LSYTNFEVGQTFPLPIQTPGDGGLFQIDRNGIMFILKLSRTDVIAAEAFRTGRMELALYEEKGQLFFLYQIDGIFKDGWGDAPLALSTLPAEQLPEPGSLKDPAIHLYLVDARLNTLLALRTVQLDAEFFAKLQKQLEAELAQPFTKAEQAALIGQIYQRMMPNDMRAAACVVQEVRLDLNIMAHPVQEKPSLN